MWELRYATPTGLEPATSAVTGRRANQLRYGAKLWSCLKRLTATAILTHDWPPSQRDPWRSRR